MNKDLNLQSLPHVREAPLTGWKAVAFFVPFVFLILLESAAALLPQSPLGPRSGWLRMLVSLLIWLLALGVALLALTGLFKKLPGWALPSLGLVLAFANLFLGGPALMFILGRPSSGAFFLPLTNHYAGVSATYVFLAAALIFLVYMLPVLLLGGILFFLAPFLPGLEAIFGRFRRDWSLLALLVYFNYLVTASIGFDPPQGSAPYRAASTLILGAGAGLFFLLARAWPADPWLRLAALLAAAFAAQTVIAVGEYALAIGPGVAYPSLSDWLVGGARLVGALGSLLPLALPAILSLFPNPSLPSSRPSQTPVSQ